MESELNDVRVGMALGTTLCSLEQLVKLLPDSDDDHDSLKELLSIISDKLQTEYAEMFKLYCQRIRD